MILGFAFLISCHSDFESPYLPGSKDYAGDDWTRDDNGNGIADSVEKYSPDCKLSPQKCLEQAKVLSGIALMDHGLAATDMILWLGDSAMPPRLVFTPADLSFKGYVLTSSDSSRVKPVEGKLVPVSVGSAQISVAVPGDSAAASFLAKVVSSGKPVVSVSVKDLTVPVGTDTTPEITWTPSDAAYRDFSLQSDKPSVALALGQKIRGISPGNANVTLATMDGDRRAAFSVTVTEAKAKRLADSLWVEDVFIVKDSAPESPIVHWVPDQVTDKRYTLMTGDSNTVGVTKEKDKVVPKALGTVHMYALALDGSGKSAEFNVTVVLTQVAVKGISAADMTIPIGADPESPTLTWTPSDATNRKYVLESANTGVAEIKGSLIQPIALGAAKLTVTSVDGGFRDTFMVYVNAPDTTIHVDSVSVADFSMPLGSDRKPAVVWHPDSAGNRAYSLVTLDSAVAVPAGDLIHPLQAGVARMRVISQDKNRTADFKVTVYAPTIPVTAVAATPMSIVIGDSDQAPVLTWTPGNATNRTYRLTSDAVSIASVVGTKVHAVGVGSTNINVFTDDGPFTSFTVTVNANAVTVSSITAGKMTLNFGDADADPLITWTPANATNKNYLIKSSSNTSAVSVVANKIHAEGPGVSALTIEAQGGSKPTAVCSVTVISLVKSIHAKPDTLRLGDPDQDPSSLFTWDPVNPGSKAFTLKSIDSTTVKTVNGVKLRALRGGSTKVVVRASDGSGKVDTFSVTVLVPVQAVSAKDDTLRLGDAAFNPGMLFTWLPSNATNQTWTLAWPGSPQTNIVTFPNNWQLLAMGAGTAKVVVVSAENSAVHDTFNVTVVIPVTSLSVASFSIKVGDPDQAVVPVWNPTNATDKSFILGGGNTSVATIVNNKIHAVGTGSANFTATSRDGGKTASFTVTVAIPVVSISAADFTMKVGDPDRTPAITWNPTNASDKTFTLSGGTAGIATVVGNLVHAEGPGSAVINVLTTDGSKTASCTVTIGVPVISISATDISMRTGDPDRDPAITWNPANATNKGYSLSSSNPSAVTISAGNKLHAAGAGTSTITITTSDGGKTATFTVTVTVPVSSIVAADVVMKKGDSDRVASITWYPTNASNKNYTLTGGDPGIATVVNNLIHAVDGGTTSMIVTTADGGKVDTFNVTVNVPVTGINAQNMVMQQGDTGDPNLTWNPANATNKNYTLESQNPNIVSIISGRMFASRKGVATIKVTTADGGFTATFQVAVL